ncbi:MAG: DVU_1551 family NTP transferase, partial [Desulfovibrionales bacterium]
METDIHAVIPAAGLSSRMDRFKPLAPLGSATVLEQVASTFYAAGIHEIVVVSGHRMEELSSAAKRAGTRMVHNPEYRKGMFSSILAGIEAIPSESSGFFLLPVDIPLVRSATIEKLKHIFSEAETDIVHPVFRGMRGHPPLLSSALIPLIRGSNGSGGLRSVLEKFERENPERVLEVAVADAGILQDMDTDDQYARVAKRWPGLSLPTREECEAVMDLAGTPDRTRLHGRAVAQVAVAVGRAVNNQRINGPLLDLEQIERAGLVHDLAKGSPAHEREGGRILSEAGFTDISEIVASHRDIDPKPGSPVTETEVVFLADKVVAGTDLVPLVARYEAVLQRHGHDPEAREAILGRRERALRVKTRVEHVMARSLPDVAAEAL